MPAVDIKNIGGFLNTDDNFEFLPKTHHAMAKNGVFRGNPGNMRFQNVPGTRLITNNLPSGDNESIGAYFDELRQRVYWFNYNSNDNHGIYVYYLRTEAIDRIAVVGYNTDGDIFGFDLGNPIYNVKILYGDSTQGDILYFNNSQKQPCQINVTRALTGDYGTIERSFIDVAKEPPQIPPAVVYEDDATVTVNNLRKKLFKFKVRNVFGNKEKSVTSSQSELPLPVNYTDSNIDKDPTKNCRIAIVIPTGSPEVRKLEVLAAQSGVEADGVSLPNQFSDFFLIQSLDKDELNIPDNDLYTFRFYNDQAYIPIDIRESLQLQDLVPLEANALEFLNGNVPIYGGIKEGYDLVPLSAATTSSSAPEQTTQYPFIFSTSQSGDSGFGTGNIHAVVIGSMVEDSVFNIYTTNETISYTVLSGDDSSDVISGLSAAAVLLGFTVISSDSENLYIVKTGEELERSLTTSVLIDPSDSFVYDWNSRYSWGVVYFDEKGRTNGVITNLDLPIQTVNYTETSTVPNIPKIDLSISSRPPDWAYYYQIVRTKNLSKIKFLYWVSDRTYKDTEYAYISIENLNRFIIDNPTSAHLAYSFAPNDRIRFLKVLSGSVNTIYTNQDFEIQGQVFSPTINGTVQEGQFLKIALPTTSSTFDFGTNAFYNYFIQIYTPAKSVSNGLDLYYEFGERYAIGNPGTVTAFHQGMLQNQTSDLVSPATFSFTKGDDYYRYRTINTGGDLNYLITAGERSAGRHTMGVTFVDRTFTDTNITTGNSPLQNLSSWTYASSSRAIIIMGAASGLYTFRAKGTINVYFEYADTFSYFFQDQAGNVTYAVTPRQVPQGTNSFSFDCTFQLNSSGHISFLGWSQGDFGDVKWYSETNLKITIQNPYTVGVIDQNFSDFFESAVNSNGREWVADPNAAQTYYPTLMRWGLQYEVDTNLNRTNRFYSLNFDEVDRGKGDIMRFRVWEMTLRIYQKRATGSKAIYGKILQDSSGGNILSTTDEIITKNNVNYYNGELGIGNQPTALISSKNADYIIDPVRGYQARIDSQGIEIISLTYKGQYFIQPKFIPYESDYLRTNGSKAKILGAYNYAEEECMTILQGGTYSGNTILPYTFSFNEKRNSYSSFFDIYPDWMIGAQDKLISWKNGQLYVHDNTDSDSYTKFYGVKYYPSIQLVFNDQEPVRRTFDTVSYQSNQKWVCPIIGGVLTSEINEYTNLQQVSQLKEDDFSQRGNYFDAALLRDANSGLNRQIALLEGDFLSGQWISLNFTYVGNDFAWIFEPYVQYQLNNRNF